MEQQIVARSTRRTMHIMLFLMLVMLMHSYDHDVDDGDDGDGDGDFDDGNAKGVAQNAAGEQQIEGNCGVDLLADMMNMQGR